jgi:signal transduction histidine kinase
VTAPIHSGSIGELFWRVSEAVVLVDARQVIAWNPSAERMFGLTPDEDTDPEGLFGGILGAAYPQLRALLSEPGTAVIDAVDSCGLVLDVKSWAIEGSDIRMLIVTDVTASRRLSDGLARLSALGRELLVSEPELPDLLQQLVDEAKSITYAEFSALLLLHPEHEDVVSHFVYNAPREQFPEQLPRAVGILALPVLERQAVVVDDIRGHPSGVGIPSRHPPIGPLLAAPVLAGETILGEIAVANAPGQRLFDEVDRQLLTDLAAHAGIAVRWAEARERARRDREIREEIVATARHDIRNPLTIGRGYAAMLETRLDRMRPEQVASALAAVRTAFESIEGFASRALLGEDEAADAEVPEWTEIAVQPLLQSLEADHNAGARDVGTEVVTTCEPGTPAAFAGDARMVREVLDNLVTNAIKYGIPLGVITVTVRGEGEHVRFDIHNDGEGIPLDDQQRIFDRYWRADGVREGDIPGTGLGLAIVRRLVQLQHGVVGVASRPDEGTTFWVTFPLAAPQLGSA